MNHPHITGKADPTGNAQQHAAPLGYRQRGVSLIELMIALTISVFLMLGVFQLFVGSSGTDRISHAFARVQETGRLALDILSRNIRMAGYQGCIDPATVDMNIIADNPPSFGAAYQGLLGYELDVTSGGVLEWSPSLDGSLTKISSPRPNSDVIAVNFVNPTGVGVWCDGYDDDADGIFKEKSDLNKACIPVNANVKIDNNSVGISKYDVVVVSDCVAADMFRVVNTTKDDADNKTNLAHSNSHNSSNNLSKAYGEDAQVMTVESLAYYVKDTGRGTAANPVYALYQFDATFHDGTGTPVGREDELVEGVEQLQILYGLRLATNNLRFLTADNLSVSDFAQVEAVRFAVLVSSSEQVLPEDDARTYALPGADIKPKATNIKVFHEVDRKLRRVFTQTIHLRNQV